MRIDFHVHTFLDKLAANAVASLAARAHFTPYTDGTVRDTDRAMREGGVDAYVALNIAVSPRSERHVNDFAISLTARSDVFPFGSVHPDSPNALSELDRLCAAGVRGVKFHNEYQNFYVDEDSAFPLYEACAKRGLILLFHGGADRGFEPPVKTPPARMRRVALAFPEAKNVGAHRGGHDMTEAATDELADTNVFVDTSFAARSLTPERGEAAIRAFGADRVLFGTDCPWDTPQNAVGWLESMALSAAEKEKIYGGNACRLLGIAEK